MSDWNDSGLIRRDSADRESRRFRLFAESEHQRQLRASFVTAFALSMAAIIAEYFAFGGRFGLMLSLLSGGLMLAQVVYIGWRVKVGRPNISPLARCLLIIANSGYWALLCAWHTLSTDSSPYLYELLLIHIVFCYFFAGLVQGLAVMTGLIVGLSMTLALGTLGESSGEAVSRACFVLVAVNLIGASGRWWIELNQRAQYLTQLMLRSQAISDPLTGLQNRRGLRIGLDTAIHMCSRDNLHVAVAVLDLDKLKPINDRFGHAAGDQVIREFARRLRSAVRRSTDTAARTGGDEFALVWSAKTVKELEFLADRLHELVSSLSIEWNTEERTETLHVSASIGVLLVIKPHAQIDLAEVLGRADSLALEAKRNGGNSVIVRQWEPQQRLLPSLNPPHHTEPDVLSPKIRRQQAEMDRRMPAPQWADSAKHRSDNRP